MAFYKFTVEIVVEDQYADQDKAKHKLVKSISDDVGNVSEVKVIGGTEVVKDWVPVVRQW